jgi:hypothetical protein
MRDDESEPLAGGSATAHTLLRHVAEARLALLGIPRDDLLDASLEASR